MLSILSAISTETIIGIVAIIVIVISAGIIIATAVRNYLLHKKAMIEAEKNGDFEEDFPIQEIKDDEQTEVEANADNVIVTAEEIEQSNNVSEVSDEFAEENEEVEEIQEIDFTKNPEKPDESKVDNGLEDINTNEVDDKSMDELLDKLANRQM